MFSTHLGLQPSTTTVNKEDRLNIESLQEYIQELKLQLRTANGQVKSLSEQIEQRKKEIERLKKTAYLNKRPPLSSTGRTDQSSVLEIVPGKNPCLDNSRHELPSTSIQRENIDSGLLEVARNLKQRYIS